MKKIHLLSLSATVLFLAVLSSCSVQKRHYTKGYHVSWGKRKASSPASLAQTQAAPATAKVATAAAAPAGLPPKTPVAASQPVTANEAPARINTKTPRVSGITKSSKSVATQKPSKRLEEGAAGVQMGDWDPSRGKSWLPQAESAFPYTNYGNGTFGSLLIGVFASIVGIALMLLFFFLIDALLFTGGEILLLLILAGMLIALVVVGILFAINAD